MEYIILCILLVVVCSPLYTECKKRNPKCPLKQPFKTLTYNAVLTDNAWIYKGLQMSGDVSDRRDALIKYLETTDASVVCLQEVHNGRDLEKIVKGLSAKFPYAQSQLHLFNGILPDQDVTADWRGNPRCAHSNYSTEWVPVPEQRGFQCHNETEIPLCDKAAVTSLSTCVDPSPCTPEFGLSALLQCLVTHCHEELLKIVATRGGSKCITCLINGYPGFIDSCSENTDELYVDFSPMGLVLLSKRPMSNRLVVPHFQGVPQIMQRGYIQATIDDCITIACSHQTTTDSVAFEPLLSEFIANPDRQNEYEINDLIGRLGDKKALLLLGDLNVGGSCRDVRPVKEERFKKLVGVFDTDTVKQCTYCSTNPYNALDTTDVDVTIDHIMTTAPLAVTDAKVVLTVDDASIDIDGTLYPLSDHYGVEATIACARHSRKSSRRRSSKRGNRWY